MLNKMKAKDVQNTSMPFLCGERKAGITLVALVVTIIILIILAAVTINILMGENGIISKASEGSKQYSEEMEKEQVTLLVGDAVIEKLTKGSGAVYGTELTSKQVGINNGIWNTISETGEDIKVYGTDWYYIAAGTDLEDIGTIKKGYIVNYRTGEVVIYDSAKHTELSNDMSLAVKRNLVFNLDPSNMSGNEGDWGDDVVAHGFTDPGTGFVGKSFNFNGTTDYVSVYAGDDFSEGFTIEVYGRSNKGAGDVPLIAKQAIGSTADSFRMTFRQTLGSWSNVIFNLWQTDSGSEWNLGLAEGTHNMKKQHNFGLITEDFYITMTFDPSTLTVSIYNHGVFIDSTTVNQAYWDASKINVFEDDTIPINLRTYDELC